MSSNLPTLIKQNDLALAIDDQTRLIRLCQEKAITYLSIEKESGPFLLYAVGDSISTIAVKTNLPKDVILLTAIYYRWSEKVKFLQKDGLDPEFLQKELANTLLVATYKSMIDDLGQVIAGKKMAKDVGLIPKNMAALNALMEMVSKINAPKELPTQPTQTTVIHAEQVQVNQQLSPSEVKVMDPKRLEMLKAIDG